MRRIEPSLCDQDRSLLGDDESLMKVPKITEEAARRDIDTMLWSMKLHTVRRFFHQRFWEEETREAEYASRVEPHLRLESVAEHSWHVADTVLLLAGHFSGLDCDRATALAVVHDKLEIVTGDLNPVGRDGTGQSTHAFDLHARLHKERREDAALEYYLVRIRPGAQAHQRSLFREIKEAATPEAKFVKSIDKLQALGYVLLKKKGHFSDRHLRFTVQYSGKVTQYFPGLATHLADEVAPEPWGEFVGVLEVRHEVG